MAKMIGFFAIEAIISFVSVPFCDRPKTHVGAAASPPPGVRASVSTACADFHWFMPSVRPW